MARSALLAVLVAYSTVSATAALPQPTLIGPFGHMGSKMWFDDWTSYRAYGIKSITMHAGNGEKGAMVHKISVEYSHGAQRMLEHGADISGKWSPWVVQPHDPITRVHLCTNQAPNMPLFGVSFCTMHGHCSPTFGTSTSCDRTVVTSDPAYAPASNERVIRAPAGTSLQSFLGVASPDARTGSVWQLGLYFAVDCETIVSVTAGWFPFLYSNADSTISYQYGLSRDHEIDDTKTWSQRATMKASLGFKFDVVGDVGTSASAGLDVSDTDSKSIASSSSVDFELDGSLTEQVMLGAGQLWIWRWEVKDLCGTTTVATNNVVVTPSRAKPPCCPIGYAQDPTKQHGDCTKASLSIC